jgi:hypothetical protein
MRDEGIARGTGEVEIKSKKVKRLKCKPMLKAAWKG